MSTLTKVSVTGAVLGAGLMLGGCASPTGEAEDNLSEEALQASAPEEQTASAEDAEDVGSVSSEIVYGPGYGYYGPGYGYGYDGPGYGYGYYGPGYGYGVGYGTGLGYGVSRGYGYGVSRGYRSYGSIGAGYGGYGGYGVLW